MAEHKTEWPSSDELLSQDKIAEQKIVNPFDAPGETMTESGIILPDIEDDEANEAAAAVVLAQLAEDDEDADGEVGTVADDDEIEDTDDTPMEEI